MICNGYNYNGNKIVGKTYKEIRIVNNYARFTILYYWEKCKSLESNFQ